MAHHSNEQLSEEFLKQFNTKEELGATGKFPEGKLTPEDQGEIMTGITTVEGKVVVNFGKQIAWIGFTRNQALEFGNLLISKALDIKEKG